MTIQQATDAILNYHPQIDALNTCDGFKCGNPSEECRGIVTTCAVTVEVIKKTAKLGHNLIITHEPSFYTHMDKTGWLEGKNEVFDEKMKLLDDNGIAIWRDHDRIHAHKPDGIFYGVMKELGWQDYLIGDKDSPLKFELPRTTVRSLAKHLQNKLRLNAVRIIGNADGEAGRVAFCGHVLPRMTPEEHPTKLLDEFDVIIPGELIDWTVASYARDAGQLGKNKAIINIGHFNMEELGMKHAARWISGILDNTIPVDFIRSGDMYQYLI